MKEKIIWTVALVILFSLSGIKAYNIWLKKEDAPVEVKATLKENIIDIGRVAQSGESKATFEITNDGTNPIRIESIDADCDCTVIDWDSSPIKPGQRTFITLQYNNEITGFFEQKANVYFEKSKVVLLLIMRGTIC